MESLSLIRIAKDFSDEHKAWELVESLRWPNGPICPHCDNNEKHYYLGNRKTRQGNVSPRRVWKCGSCRKQFSALVGTIFERSHVPLSKWLMAVHMMCAGKNGVSAHEIARTLEVSLKTAWFMAHRVREAMSQEPMAERLSGTIEADETFIGGKRRGTPRGRPTKDSHKTPVVSLVQRDGEARSTVVPDVTSTTLGSILKENVDPAAILMTDEYKSYEQPARGFAAHHTVKHRAKEYARGEVTTNTVEGFFGQLKRSLNGTHHHVSRQHLHRYLKEFDYRYSTRKMSDGERTALTIRKAEGKRLVYRQTQPGSV